MEKITEKTHYIYIWSHEDFGIFYVGQGNQRRFSGCDRQKYSRAYEKHRDQQTLLGFIHNNNIKHTTTIISENLTKEQADEKEIYIINFLGRKYNDSGILLNLADGGSSSKPLKIMKKQIVNGIEFESISEVARYYDISHAKATRNLRNNKNPGIYANKVEYKGIEYNNMRELGEYFGLTPAQVSYRLKHNIQLEYKKETIIYDGVEYSSYKELAKKYNLTTANVKRRLKHNIPLEQKPHKNPVLYDGILYGSAQELANFLGVTRKFVTYRIKDGVFYYTPKIDRGERRWKK